MRHFHCSTQAGGSFLLCRQFPQGPSHYKPSSLHVLHLYYLLCQFLFPPNPFFRRESAFSPCRGFVADCQGRTQTAEEWQRSPRGPLCVLFLLFPQRISAVLWGSKLLWHLDPHKAACHRTLQLLEARFLVSRRAKAFCTGINPIHYGTELTQGSCKLT